MTAKEALKISSENTEKEFKRILENIKASAEDGKVKAIFKYEVGYHTLGRLMDLGYDYSYYSHMDVTLTTIGWLNGRDKRREDDNI